MSVEPSGRVEQEYELSEPPERVWRALSIPAFRDRWLPPDALASPEPASVTSGREISFRMREPDPPFLESTVTFRIVPNDAGGTCLRVIHDVTDARVRRATSAAANSNAPSLRRAA